jgi:hypothetical protein
MLLFVDKIVELIEWVEKSAEYSGSAALMRCSDDMDVRCEKWEK